MRERSFELDASQPLSRIAGEGAARSKAGEGLAIPGFAATTANLPSLEQSFQG
jgi:hypothetical protein